MVKRSISWVPEAMRDGWGDSMGRVLLSLASIPLPKNGLYKPRVEDL